MLLQKKFFLKKMLDIRYSFAYKKRTGSLAQLVERRPYKADVTGSSPVVSTIFQPHILCGFFCALPKTGSNPFSCRNKMLLPKGKTKPFYYFF